MLLAPTGRGDSFGLLELDEFRMAGFRIGQRSIKVTAVPRGDNGAVADYDHDVTYVLRQIRAQEKIRRRVTERLPILMRFG